MKQLLTLLLLITLFNCSSPLEEKGNTENQETKDSLEIVKEDIQIPGKSSNNWYVPKTVQTDIALEGSMNDLPTDFSFDTTYNDSNALYLITQDSVYLYSHFEDSIYNEGISKNNPEFDIESFNTAFSSVALDSSGLILDSITLDSVNVSLDETETSLNYTVIQDFTLHTALAEYSSIKVLLHGAATISTKAEKYNAQGFPENWPSLE